MRHNPSLVLKIYEAIAAKDAAAIQGMSAPDIVVQQSAELPWGGTYRGLPDAMKFFHRVQDHIDSQVMPERILDAGDQVAVLGRTAGVVRGSGQSFSVPLVHLWTFHNGRVSALTVLLDNPAMLQALQLQP